MKNLRCLNCGCVIKVDRAEAGKSWRCPKCKSTVLSYPRETLVAQNAVCAYCGAPILDRDISVSCPNCRLEYHEDCWKDGEGCQTVGCSYQGNLKKTERIEAMSIPDQIDYPFSFSPADSFAPAAYGDFLFVDPNAPEVSPRGKKKTSFFKLVFYCFLVFLGKTLVIFALSIQFVAQIFLRIGRFYVRTAESFKNSSS